MSYDTFNFIHEIHCMNVTYELGVSNEPVAPSRLRVDNFYKILQEEVEELDGVFNENDKDKRLVAYADLLGDVVVYCTSEAARHGIDLNKVLYAIMESNKSKLGEDGKPIKDERGKFLKGPNYQPPEPAIKEILLPCED